MGVNIATIAYLRVLIIEIESTIFLMVVEAQGSGNLPIYHQPPIFPRICWMIFLCPLDFMKRWMKQDETPRYKQDNSKVNLIFYYCNVCCSVVQDNKDNPQFVDLCPGEKQV